MAICAANTAVMSAPPLCTEGAVHVPEEGTRQWEVSAQENNGPECSL